VAAGEYPLQPDERTRPMAHGDQQLTIQHASTQAGYLLAGKVRMLTLDSAPPAVRRFSRRRLAFDAQLFGTLGLDLLHALFPGSTFLACTAPCPRVPPARADLTAPAPEGTRRPIAAVQDVPARVVALVAVAADTPTLAVVVDPLTRPKPSGNDRRPKL